MDIPLFTASATGCVERNGRRFFRSANVSSVVSVEDARAKAKVEAQRRAERAANGEMPLSVRLSGADFGGAGVGAGVAR